MMGSSVWGIVVYLVFDFIGKIEGTTLLSYHGITNRHGDFSVSAENSTGFPEHFSYEWKFEIRSSELAPAALSSMKARLETKPVEAGLSSISTMDKIIERIAASSEPERDLFLKHVKDIDSRLLIKWYGCRFLTSRGGIQHRPFAEESCASSLCIPIVANPPCNTGAARCSRNAFKRLNSKFNQKADKGIWKA